MNAADRRYVSEKFRPMALPALGMLLCMTALWGAGKLRHARDSIEVPVAPQGALGYEAYHRAFGGTGNDLFYKANYEGHAIAFDAQIQRIELTPDKSVLVVMKSGDGTLATIASGPKFTCSFPDPKVTLPLSSWTFGQVVWLTGRMGSAPGTIDGCTMAAYVDASGKPAGLGNVGETTGGGKVRHLDPAQVFPPGAPLPHTSRS